MVRMTFPPTFQCFTTSGGARVYRLPLEAFPNFWAYAYLVLADGYRVLIDCGSGNDVSRASFEAALAQVNQQSDRPVRYEDLTHILITHGHIDHFSGLVFLRERTKALVGVHELDLHTLSRHEERLAVISHRLGVFLSEAGVETEPREQMLRMHKFTKAIYHSLPVDFTYEAEGMKVGPFEMLHVPGHCPGHVVIRLDDIVFSGDHVLAGMTTHQSPEQLIPYNGLGHYLESLSRFERWADGASVILGGHNAPIEDLSGRIAAIRRHIKERLQQTFEFLAGAHSIVEVAEKLYGRMGGYNALLVTEKAGAYVEYLYQRGMLEIVNMNEMEESAQPVTIRYCSSNHLASSEILVQEVKHVFV
jgi:glyoxylase-like metal-dependent hydrolase (beta-lactamase superfamily II)